MSELAVDRASHPYVDVELCFDADLRHIPLARSVSAEVAEREGADVAYVERVRHVTGQVAAALVVVADDEATVECLLRVLDGQIRLHMCVAARRTPGPESTAEHARLLDQLIVSASTITAPGPDGGYSVACDAFIPLG